MFLQSLFISKANHMNKDAFINDRAPIRGSVCAREASFKEVVDGNHAYLESGSGLPIVFCPGLYGSVYNIASMARELSRRYRIIVPYLPLYDQPLRDCTVPKLADYLDSFLKHLKLNEAVFIGSSMGGGTLLHYAQRARHIAKGLVLCGSSGLSTIPMRKGFFKRKEFEYVRKITQDVFYDPSTPPGDMVKEVYHALQDCEIVLRSIRFTKSTAVDQLHDRLSAVRVPCLLIWGKQDVITPPEVGMRFNELLPCSELHLLDQCGHVPTQEHPDQVLNLLHPFLQRLNYA